jgi:ferredoxin
MEDLIKIAVFDRYGEKFEFDVPDDIGISLMELCKANDLPIMATCGGMALCATCHVLVESDNLLKEMGEDEELMLDQLPNMRFNSRLSCQIPVNRACDGLIVRLAED